MQAITAPINPRDQSPRVNNLQQALRFLLNKSKIDIPPVDYKSITSALDKEQQTQVYGSATQNLVQLFQKQYSIANQEGFVDDDTAATLNAVLEFLGAFEIQVAAGIVKGFVKRSDGKIYSQGMVVAYDCDLRRTEELGKSNIENMEGYYEISYDGNRFKHAEKGNADLQVRLLNPNNEILLVSEIYYNAPMVQEINLILPVSEWTSIEEQVPPLLIGQKEIKKDDKTYYFDLPPAELVRSDFEFLSKETGLALNHLRLWALSYAAANTEASIPTWAYYAWFRKGMATELRGLLARSQKDLKKTLYDALAQNIIGATTDDLDKILARIAELRPH